MWGLYEVDSSTDAGLLDYMAEHHEAVIIIESFGVGGLCLPTGSGITTAPSPFGIGLERLSMGPPRSPNEGSDTLRLFMRWAGASNRNLT